MYWHSICAYRTDAAPALLKGYHLGMKVGHHTAYEKAVRLLSGNIDPDSALTLLKAETEDLEFSIFAYGAAQHLIHIGRSSEADALIEGVLVRDGFWPSFAFLAAWNDRNGGLNVQS